MVLVCGKPFLEHQIALLRGQGILEILLLVGYLAEQITSYFGDGSAHGVHISYSQESRPMGTGGALKLAQSTLRNTFLLLNGDTYLPTDYQKKAAHFATLKSSGLVVCTRKEDSLAAPNLAVSSDMRVLGRDADALTHVNAGVMMFSDAILKALPDSQPCSLEDAFPPLLEHGSVHAYEVPMQYFDMGTPAGLQRLESFIGRTADLREQLSPSP